MTFDSELIEHYGMIATHMLHMNYDVTDDDDVKDAFVEFYAEKHHLTDADLDVCLQKFREIEAEMLRA